MERILEPEIMEDAEQALAYAKADFSTSNQWYVDHLLADFPKNLGNVLDIGCGPADVPVRLARAHPTIRITAIDGSGAMLALAQKAVEAAGLQKRVATVQGYTFGLGFAVRQAAGVAGVPGSAGEFMWGGYAGTYFWVDPKEQIVAVYMTQAPSPIRAYYRKLFKQLVYSAITD